MNKVDTRGRHPIRVVALRTGLSPSVLRAWERRYRVVEPSRSNGGQRLYSDADIERLALLNRATQAGRSISQVARLTSTELEGLVQEDEAALRAELESRVGSGSNSKILRHRPVDHVSLEEAMAAVESLDAGRLDAVVKRAAVALGATHVTESLLVPLLRRIGDRWQEGTLRPRHEHMATVVLRNLIGWLTEAVEPAETAPRIIIGTPTGERHEIGAMLAASVAAAEGWQVILLGSDLPAEDVSAGATEVGAAAVGLSFINPNDVARWGRYLLQLRQQLPDDVQIIVGGQVAGMLGVALERPGVVWARDLTDFRSVLRSIQPAHSVT